MIHRLTAPGHYSGSTVLLGTRTMSHTSEFTHRIFTDTVTLFKQLNFTHFSRKKPSQFILIFLRKLVFCLIFDHDQIPKVIIIIIITIIINSFPPISYCGPGSSVGIATDYGLDGPGSNPVGTRFSALPDRPWGPTNLL